MGAVAQNWLIPQKFHKNRNCRVSKSKIIMGLWFLALKARKAANWPRTQYTGLTVILNLLISTVLLNRPIDRMSGNEGQGDRICHFRFVLTRMNRTIFRTRARSIKRQNRRVATHATLPGKRCPEMKAKEAQSKIKPSLAGAACRELSFGTKITGIGCIVRTKACDNEKPNHFYIIEDVIRQKPLRKSMPTSFANDKVVCTNEICYIYM